MAWIDSYVAWAQAQAEAPPEQHVAWGIAILAASSPPALGVEWGLAGIIPPAVTIELPRGEPRSATAKVAAAYLGCEIRELPRSTRALFEELDKPAPPIFVAREVTVEVAVHIAEAFTGSIELTYIHKHKAKTRTITNPRMSVILTEAYPGLTERSLRLRPGLATQPASGQKPALPNALNVVPAYGWMPEFRKYIHESKASMQDWIKVSKLAMLLAWADRPDVQSGKLWRLGMPEFRRACSLIETDVLPSTAAPPEVEGRQ